MIQFKEMMQDKDLKNSKSKDKGSRSSSQSMNDQSHYKQEKTKTRPKKAKLKLHIFNIGEDKINADVSTEIEDGYHDSKGDIIKLKNLPINDNIPNLLPEVFLDINPKRLNDDPDNYLKSMVKVMDPRIHEKLFLRHMSEDTILTLASPLIVSIP
ncbi:hypothetical protein Tco_1238634 [Tanacetum coccineum]